MKTKILVILLSALALFALATKTSFASEGIIELRNTIGGTSRCFAVSTLMPTGEYHILFTCRDLIYPISSDLFIYAAWAQPVDGTDPIKLGGLGAGKQLYKTTKAFSTLFVTQEKSLDPLRAPTGPVAMRGNVSSIPFLDNGESGPVAPQPGTPAVNTPFPTLIATPTPRTGVSNILKGGGIITAISVFVIILMLILVKPFK